MDSPPQFAHYGRRRSSPGIVFTTHQPFTFGSVNPDETYKSDTSSHSSSQVRPSGNDLATAVAPTAGQIKRTSLVVENRRFSSPREGTSFGSSGVSPHQVYPYTNKSSLATPSKRPNNVSSGGNTPSDYLAPRKESNATTVAFGHRDSVATRGYRDDDEDDAKHLSIADTPNSNALPNNNQSAGGYHQNFSTSSPYSPKAMKDSGSAPATLTNSPYGNMSPMSVFLSSAVVGTAQGPLGSGYGLSGSGHLGIVPQQYRDQMAAFLHHDGGGGSILAHDSSSAALSPNTIGALSISARPLSLAESRRRSSSSQQSGAQRPAPAGPPKSVVGSVAEKSLRGSVTGDGVLSPSGGSPSKSAVNAASLEATRLKMNIPVLRRYLVDELKTHASETRRLGRESTTQLTFGTSPIGRSSSISTPTTGTSALGSAKANNINNKHNQQRPVGPMHDPSDAGDLSLMQKRIPAWMVEDQDPMALPTIQKYFSVKDKQRRDKAITDEHKRIEVSESIMGATSGGGIGGSGGDTDDQQEGAGTFLGASISPRLGSSSESPKMGGIKGRMAGLVQSSRLGLDHHTLAKMQKHKIEPVSPTGRRTMMGGGWDSPFDSSTKNSKPSALLVEGGGAAFVSSVAYKSPYVQKILAPLLRQSKERERLLESTGGGVGSGSDGGAPFDDEATIRPSLSMMGVVGDLVARGGPLVDNGSFASSAMLPTPALAALALANAANSPSTSNLVKEALISGSALQPTLSQSFSGRFAAGGQFPIPFGVSGGGTRSSMLRRRSSVEGAGGANKKPLSTQDHLVATVLLEEGERKKRALLAATSRGSTSGESKQPTPQPQKMGSSQSLNATVSTLARSGQGQLATTPEATVNTNKNIFEAYDAPDMDALSVPLLSRHKDKPSAVALAQYEVISKMEHQNPWLVEPKAKNTAWYSGSSEKDLTMRQPRVIGANTGTMVALSGQLGPTGRVVQAPSLVYSHAMEVLTSPDHYHNRYDCTAMPTRHLLQHQMRERQDASNSLGPQSSYLTASQRAGHSDLQFDGGKMLTEAKVRSEHRVEQRKIGLLLKCIEDNESIARRQIVLSAAEEARQKAVALDAEFEQTNRWKRPYKPKIRA